MKKEYLINILKGSNRNNLSINLKIIILLLALFSFTITAASLKGVRSNIEAKKQRIVLDISGIPSYNSDKEDNVVTIKISNIDLASNFNRDSKIDSRFIENFSVTNSGKNGLLVSFNLKSGSKLKNTFKLLNKDRKGARIVIDVIGGKNTIKDKPSNTTTSSKSNKKMDTKKKPNVDKKIIDTPKTKSKKTNKKENIDKADKKSYNLKDVKEEIAKSNYLKAKELVQHILNTQNELSIQISYHEAYIEVELSRTDKEEEARIKSLTKAAKILENVLTDSAGYSKARIKIAEVYRLLDNQTKALEHNQVLIEMMNKGKRNLSSKNNTDIVKKNDNNTSSMPLSLTNMIFIVAGMLIFVFIAVIIFLKWRLNKSIYEDDDDFTEGKIDEVLEEKIADEEEKIINEEINPVVEDNTSVIEDTKEESEKEETKAEEDESIDEEEEYEEDDGEDEISISLDENTRDKIIVLNEDGYSNREISEELEISRAEVDFIINSIGEEDNEKKAGDKDYINESTGGVTSEDNLPDISEKVKGFRAEGLTNEDIAEILDRDVSDIELVVSVLDEDLDSEPEKTMSTDKIEEDENRINEIKELASSGLTAIEIAETLAIGIDEVEFTASVNDIKFEAVIEESTDEVIEESTDEVIEESTEKVIEESTEKVIEESTEKVIEESTEKVIEENLTDAELDEKIENLINNKDKMLEIENMESIIQGENSDLNFDEFDNYFDDDSVLDSNIAESRIFDSMEDDFKDKFKDSLVENLKSDKNDSNETKNDEMEAEFNKFKESSEIDNEKDIIEEKIFEDEIDRRIFASEDDKEKELNFKFMVSNDELQTSKFTGSFEEAVEDLIPEDTGKDLIEEFDKFIDKENKKVSEEFNLSAEEFESHSNSLAIDETSQLSNTEEIEEEDDDMRKMKKVYSFLDEGMAISEISEKTGIDLDDVKLYKSIKEK